MSVPPIDQIIKTSTPYVTGIGGIIIGVIGVFITGFSKEFFAERERKTRYKIDVARAVHKICIEARSHGYIVSPRNYEHVTSVITDLESIDKKMSDVMQDFVTNWEFLVNDRSNGQKTDKTNFKILQEAGGEERKLSNWSNKIRAGK